MENTAHAIIGIALGAVTWIFENILGAIGYALTIVLIAPLIFAGVWLSELAANARRRRRGEPVKPFRWR